MVDTEQIILVAVVLILTFAFIFLLVYFPLRFRYKKRIAMIENGMNPDEARSKNPNRVVKMGMMLAAIGLGFIVEELLPGTLPFAILILLGLSYIGGFFFDKKYPPKDKQDTTTDGKEL